MAFASFSVALAFAQSKPTKADNSAQNKADRQDNSPTADQQKMNPADRDLTAKIRKDIMTDKSLSTYAHNVKIISQNGVVTLKGPVRSQDEMTTIVSIATNAAGGGDKVLNELTIAPPKTQK